MDLSIIIVSWNVKEKLKENLEALYKSEGNFNFNIFVVDNNSSDGTIEMIKENFKQVKLIVNKKNLGFARANNQAIKKILKSSEEPRYILLLNPDMKVMPDTLNSMLCWMDKNKNASIAGCTLIDENRNSIKHVRRFPKISDQLIITLKFPHLFKNILNNYIINDFDYSKDSKVDSIRGGFFMIRTLIIKKIGLLDERYFLWFEEVDFCREVYKNNGEVWYTSTAQCVDYVGQSFKKISRGQSQIYFRDSMLKYFKKWHPYHHYLLLKIAWFPGLLFSKLNIKSKAKT